MKVSVPQLGCFFAPSTETLGCNKPSTISIKRIAAPRIGGFVVSAWQSGGYIFVYLPELVGKAKGANLGVSRPPACFITQTMFLVHI